MIRGVDRNRTILDGEFERENGVFVVGADGVAVENLTARNFTENGFFWNGVLGYRGSYLTAYRNGDYGVYAYDSQYGQFDHSYASGSPDSGFYIGQCNPCHAVITDVVSEYNQLGYSGIERERRPLPRELGVVAQPHRHRAEQLRRRGARHRRVRRPSPATSSRDNGDPRRGARQRAAFDAGVRRRHRDRRRASATSITKNRVADNAKVGIALAPSPGLAGGAATGRRATRSPTTWCERSGLADLAVVLADARRRQLLLGQHVHHVGARRTSNR